MFDLTSSKLLMLGILALIVVGPKDLPVLLRTIGKYVGMIRRQATEFRAQFDEAIREAELDQIRTEVEKVTRDAEATMRDAEKSVNTEMAGVKSAMETSLADPPAAAESAEGHAPPAPAALPPLVEPLPAAAIAAHAAAETVRG